MSNDEPVRLHEVPETGGRFLIYAADGGVNVEVQYEGESLWMTQAQMAALFGRDVSVISRHITNVVDEGELEEGSNLQFMQIARSTKPVALYSLDMIMSVGYRVSSKQATLFRKWATAVLVRFATKGFVVDVQRLKAPDQFDRVAELREIIRDIRSSEQNLYAELRHICAMCQDYDPQSQDAREFYQNMQAKLFWAVTSRTPSMVLVERADPNAPNMGLHTWPKSEVRQADALVAKNYLSASEIKELNRLTSILLDIFEDQLNIGKLTLMREAADLMDTQLRNLHRQVLQGGGTVKHTTAEARVKAVYARFDKARKAARRQQVATELEALKAQGKSLPIRRPRKP